MVSAWSAAAADMDSGAGGAAGTVFAGVDAGVSILQNIVAEGDVYQFDVGPKVDVSVGYNVTPNVAVELQSGYVYNSMSKEDGVSISSFGASADIWSVPVMANGIYTYKFNDHWQVYGGAGAGVLISTFDISGFGSSVSPNDCEFSYQGMFGIKYLFNDNLSCGLGYDFMGSLDHHWTANGLGLTTTPSYIHSILLSLTYKF